MSEPSSKDTNLKTPMIYVCGGKMNKKYFVYNFEVVAFSKIFNDACQISLNPIVLWFSFFIIFQQNATAKMKCDLKMPSGAVIVDIVLCTKNVRNDVSTIQFPFFFIYLNKSDFVRNKLKFLFFTFSVIVFDAR